MSKPILGLLIGGVLGILDGLSALVTSPDVPEVKSGIVGIVIGSTTKGLIVGVIAGLVAKKSNSIGLAIACGLTLGFLFALLIAIMQGSHYLEIILPGSLVGVIAGFVSQRYGGAKQTA